LSKQVFDKINTISDKINVISPGTKDLLTTFNGESKLLQEVAQKISDFAKIPLTMSNEESEKKRLQDKILLEKTAMMAETAEDAIEEMIEEDEVFVDIGPKGKVSDEELTVLLGEENENWIGYGSLQGKCFTWIDNANNDKIEISIESASNNVETYDITGTGKDASGKYEIVEGTFDKATKVCKFKKKREATPANTAAQAEGEETAAAQEEGEETAEIQFEITDELVLTLSIDNVANTVSMANDTSNYVLKSKVWSYNGSDDQKILYWIDENVIFGISSSSDQMFFIRGNYDGRILKIMKYDTGSTEVSRYAGGAVLEEDTLHVKGTMRSYKDFDVEDQFEDKPFNIKGNKGDLEIAEEQIPEEEEEKEFETEPEPEAALPPPVIVPVSTKKI